MMRSFLKHSASSSYARRHMLVGATSTRSTDYFYFHTHQITYCTDNNNLYQQNRQLSASVRRNNNGNAGRGRIGGRGRGRGRGRTANDRSDDFGRSGRGRAGLDKRHDSGPPTVERGKMKSITVATKKKGGSGASKYCYGCGAKIVSKEAGGKVRDSGASGGVQMGLKASAGGFWNEQKDILKISKIKNWALCPRCKELQKKSASGTPIDDQQLKELSPSHEMTQIFREQVSKIRSQENAVVVLCCDAVNPRGSLISGIRNYVGGNPILLAVTRCDLLPGYVTEDWSIKRQDEMKKFYEHQAKELNPADVYLCSVDDQYEEDIFDGAQQLSSDLLKHLNGRDAYVIGAANIGKSTLTDRLINNIIKTHQPKEEPPWAYRKHNNPKKEERKRKRRFGKASPEHLEQKRFKTIQDARVTKSSLPGTTLNNVRVPCFSDHQQALWDTPGLLLDPSVKHYPIADFARIKAKKPSKIVPQWHNSGDKKSFALIVYEKSEQDDNDAIPLLRIEVRLRKPKDSQKHNDVEQPVQLVWNSILNSEVLLTRISSIEEEHYKEERREKDAQVAAEKRREAETKSSLESVQRTPEEKAKQKELKRKLFHEKKRKEIAELGHEEYAALQKQKQDALHQQRQLKMLSTLSLVTKEKLKAGKPSELSIEHFGSLSILSPSTEALVMVYAPSSGIAPSFHDIMTLPSHWETDVSDVDDETDDETDDESDDEEESDDEFEDDDFVFDHLEGGDEWDPNVDDHFDFDSWNNSVSDYASFDSIEIERDLVGFGDAGDDADDIWSEYTGEKVGWRFDHKPRYVKGKFVDGWQPIEDENN